MLSFVVLKFLLRIEFYLALVVTCISRSVSSSSYVLAAIAAGFSPQVGRPHLGSVGLIFEMAELPGTLVHLIGWQGPMRALA